MIIIYFIIIISYLQKKNGESLRAYDQHYLLLVLSFCFEGYENDQYLLNYENASH